MVNKILQNIHKLRIVPAQAINPYISAKTVLVPKKLGTIDTNVPKRAFLQSKIIRSLERQPIQDEFAPNVMLETPQVPAPKAKRVKKPNRHINKQALAEYFDNYNEKEALDIRKQIDEFYSLATKEADLKSEKLAKSRNGWTESSIIRHFGEPKTSDLAEEFEQEILRKSNRQVHQVVKSKFVYNAMEKIFDEALPKKVKKRDGVKNFNEYVYNSIKDSYFPKLALKSNMQRDIPNLEKYSKDFGYEEFLDLKIEEVICEKVEQDLINLLPPSFKKQNKVNSIEEYLFKCLRQERNPVFAVDRFEKCSSRAEFQKYINKSRDYLNYRNYFYDKAMLELKN